MKEDIEKRLEELLIEWGKSSCDTLMPELYQYSQNRLDTEEKERVEKHLELCSRCKKALDEFLAEIEADSLEETKKEEPSLMSALVEKLKKLTSRTEPKPVIQCWEFSFDTTRGHIGQETFYPIGAELIINVKAPRDGYLIIVHSDDKGNLELFFPSKETDDTFVRSAHEQEKEMEIKGPIGKHYFKAILTSKPLINPREIDFNDDTYVSSVIQKFLGDLSHLSKDDWSAADYEFEVV